MPRSFVCLVFFFLVINSNNLSLCPGIIYLSWHRVDENPSTWNPLSSSHSYSVPPTLFFVFCFFGGRVLCGLGLMLLHPSCLSMLSAGIRALYSHSWLLPLSGVSLKLPSADVLLLSPLQEPRAISGLYKPFLSTCLPPTIILFYFLRHRISQHSSSHLTHCIAQTNFHLSAVFLPRLPECLNDKPKTPYSGVAVSYYTAWK